MKREIKPDNGLMTLEEYNRVIDWMFGQHFMKTPKRSPRKTNPAPQPLQPGDVASNSDIGCNIFRSLPLTDKQRVANLENELRQMADKERNPTPIVRLARELENDLRQMEEAERHIYQLQKELDANKAHLNAYRLNHSKHQREFDTAVQHHERVKA